MPTIRRTWKVNGVFTDVTSARLSSPDGTFGVRRDDTGAVVVADGTSMSRVSSGVYEYSFVEPAAGLAYSGFVEIVYAGQTHYFEHIIPAESIAPPSSLQMSYQRLQVAIADDLCWGRNVEGEGDSWSAEDESRMDSIIRSALTQVYYPVSASKTGAVHQWSWMRPVATLVTSAPYATGTVEIVDGVATLASGTWPDWSVDGELRLGGSMVAVRSRDSDTELTLMDAVNRDAGTTFSLHRWRYELPSDFAGMDGETFTYPSSHSCCDAPIRVLPDLAWRGVRQRLSCSGKPRWAAIRPKAFDAAVGQRWFVVFEPSPDGEYRLEYRYRVHPSMLSAAQPYPMGGADVGELILLACLAVGEQRYRGGPGPHTAMFQARIAAAIDNDAQMFSPDSVGYNGDRSEACMRFGPLRGAIHSYEGIVPYDRKMQ